MRVIDNTVLAPENADRRLASAPAQYRSLVGGEAARFAVVRNARRPEEVEAYLPSGYALVESFQVENGDKSPKLLVVIGGLDNAGWTMDDYIIPRLASGLLWAEEIN